MIEPIVKAFDGLLSDFSWRRVTALILFTLYVASFFTVSEVFTGHFRLARIEHAAKILGRLQEIEAKRFSDTSQLATIEADLTRQLREVTNPSSISLPAFSRFWRFTAATAPWLIMALIFCRGLLRRQPNAAQTVVGTIMFGIVAGVSGLFVPPFLWPWGNLFVYPAVLFIAFCIFTVRWEARKRRRAATNSVAA